jgi:hypothetical protein
VVERDGVRCEGRPCFGLEEGCPFAFIHESLKHLVRASSHVLYPLSIVESTEPKQVYGVKLDFVSERTIKDHHHLLSDRD